MKNIPILGFFIRYWLLLLVNVALVYAALNDTVFAHLGSLVYLFAVGSSLLTTTLFLRHVFFLTTLDKYAATGAFATEFWGLTPWQRQIIATVIFVGMLVALGFVANGVGK